MKTQRNTNRRRFLQQAALAAGMLALPAFYTATTAIAQDAQHPDLTRLESGFLTPPDTARPGVYWYFMDGNRNKESITKDLEAMKKAGIGYVVYLEVNVGVARGKVEFLGKEWKDMFAYTVRECERLGIGIFLGTGPGWTGSGGPWVKPEQSMQHLVHSSIEVSGGSTQTLQLPVPAPKRPFFGQGAFTPASLKQWKEFYEDVAVLAFPSGATKIDTKSVSGGGYFQIPEIEERALYYRKPYSSVSGVPQFIPMSGYLAPQKDDTAIPQDKVLDLTKLLQPDGSLRWDAPAGKWTVMRFGRRNNGAATRPAPLPGVGLEADKFDTAAMDAHLDKFIGELFRHSGITKEKPSKAIQTIHIDSWEMGAQNWTKLFREEFQKRRGYDPLPFYPVYAGIMIQSREISERFLWDLRQTAQELVLENHVGHTRKFAKKYGASLSIEPYDMTPVSDLELAAASDMPMCEFWRRGAGYNTSWSAGEGASVSHLIGQPVVPAEAFTAAGDGWRSHPGSLKNQGEWALAAGINRFMFHTFQHQPLADDRRPGMTMGPYGVHWDRNQTWWYLSDAYHRYLARCQFLLQQGRTVADILYLAPEGSPHVFRAPKSAYAGDVLLPDRKGYNFDACPPSLFHQARVENGNVVFPSGATYRLVALPAFQTMTPALLTKIRDLVRDGATIIGTPPAQSPSLSGYPACDEEVRTLAKELWGSEKPAGKTQSERSFGKGKVIWDTTPPDNLYSPYDVTAEVLKKQVPSDFETDGPIRYAHRTVLENNKNIEIYFVSNRTSEPAEALCKFRVVGKSPELWNPVTGRKRALTEFKIEGGQTSIPLKFDVDEGYFIVFERAARATEEKTFSNFRTLRTVATLDAPWTVSFDPKWGGPEKVVFDKLEDWRKRPESGIRYYSGTAFYRQTFSLSAEVAEIEKAHPTTGSLSLDLGEVKNIARVRLNGKDLGVVWAAPWRVSISGIVKEKDNVLEIEVVNLWANRLIGDAQPGVKKPYTFTTHRHFNKGSPLLSSGLLGPVKIILEQR